MRRKSTRRITIKSRGRRKTKRMRWRTVRRSLKRKIRTGNRRRWGSWSNV